MRAPWLLPVLLALAAIPAPACQICVPIPTKSLADHLLEADTVVFARENPDKPFTLRAVEVVAGETGEPELELFLNSSARRYLAAHPEARIVCTRAAGEWAGRGRADAKVLSLVRDILRLAPEWEENPRRRIEFFAPLLESDDETLRSLAHLEIGSAPYAEIRRLGSLLPPEEIRRFLDNFRMMEWHALYILLLAGSDDPEDHARIEKSMRSAAEFSITSQLGAWTVAHLETAGEAAFAFVDEHYASNRDRSDGEIAAVVTALSVFGSAGDDARRGRVLESYARLLEHHPGSATIPVADATKWKRGELAGPVRRLLERPDIGVEAPRFQLRAYLREFGTSEAPGTPEGDPSAAAAPGDPAPARTVNPLLLALPALLLLALAVAILGRRRTD